MGTNRKYWKGVEELKQTPEFLETIDKEFAQEMSVEEFLGDENLGDTSTNRRDFIKFLGFSVAAATLASCEAPVTKAIPYVNKPENVTPGMPTFYASTYYDGNSYASIVVKTREGRPIYIKGNKDFGISKGVVNPQIIASVLGLYDSARLQDPTINGKAVTWSNVDAKIKNELESIKAKNGKVVLLSNSIISPTTLSAISNLSTSLGSSDGKDNFEHIQYDAVSYAGIRLANELSFGKNIIPDYDFSKAKTIVSIGADFLGSWLLSSQFQADYLVNRNPDADWMSKHFHFETVMSLTGSNADIRGMIKPSEQANVLSYILKGFGVNSGVSSEITDQSVKMKAEDAIKSLKSSKGESLVVCGSNNKALQILVNKLNSVLGAYNHTINLNNPINLFQSQDEKLDKLVKDVIAGKGPDALLIHGSNPVYTLSNGAKFADALSKIGLTVSFSGYADETASKCKFVCPDHHALEAWNDFNPKMDHYSIAQPTIRPLFNTSAFTESILVWSDSANRGGKDSKVVYDLIKNTWEQSGFSRQTEYTDFQTYWNYAVHNSCVDAPTIPPNDFEFNPTALSGLKSQISKVTGTEVVLYQKSGIGIGTQANNPWLQELPDPISKVTWDNYITMNPVEMDGTYQTTFDQETGLNMASVKVGSNEIILPVYPSPGQAIGTIGIALGYGRGANGEKIGKAAFQTKEYGGYVSSENGNPKPIGVSVFPFSKFENGTLSFETSGSVDKVEGVYPIAATQIHHTVMGRHSIVRETTFDIYKNKDKSAYNPDHMLSVMDEDGKHVKIPVGEADLWEAHPVEHIGHRWGMAIDLSSCIGCGSCLISCQSENNVPVVGKDEVRKGREMHWIRIDRYFASDEEVAVGTRKGDLDYHKAEIASANPKVVHMPMLCHHCNHAPCETVCPVAATNHSNEGLNQMAYNRCIGTRYCANNCPYKVRRFNWFNYPSYKKFTEVNPAQDDLGRMVLNPDVTVRTRGVMEKCSFCVQRIQATKLEAKKDGTPVKDGSLQTACSEGCPTNAITVGDWNDVNSKVRKSSEDNRAYQALEEVGTKPNIWYKVKVRNEDNKELASLQVNEETAHHSQSEGHSEGHGDNKSHH